MDTALLPPLLILVPLLTAVAGRALPGGRTGAQSPARLAGQSQAGLAGWASRLGATAVLALALALLARLAAAGMAPLHAAGGWLYVDALGAYMVAAVALVAAIAAWYSPDYLRQEVAHGALRPGDERRYYLWFHLFVATMCAAVLVDNLGLMWAAIEATTLTSALLVGFYRHEAALEAAWKYLILCSAGITLALGGVVLVYYAGIRALGPGTSSLDWSQLAAVADRLDPQLMGLAFVLVLVGFGTKAGLAPMHTWLPDAHSQAPSPVSAVLSGVLLNCALYGILRLHALVGAGPAAGRSHDLLVAIGLLSVVVAVPFVVVQHDLKRLLAYSSVEHTGLIALAVGIGSPLALYGALLHVLTHALTKTLLFCSAGTLIQRYGTRRLVRLRGAARAAPLTGVVFLLGCLAIGGSPPFGPFTSELAIVAGAFAARAYLPAALLLAGLAAIFAGLLYHAMHLTLGSAPRRLRAAAAFGPEAWPLLATLCLVLLLGLWVPPAVRQVVGAAASILPARPSSTAVATSLAAAPAPGARR